MVASELECKLVREVIAVSFKQMICIAPVFIAQLLHDFLDFLCVHVCLSDNNALSPHHYRAQIASSQAGKHLVICMDVDFNYSPQTDFQQALPGPGASRGFVANTPDMSYSCPAGKAL
jgi:hypothetical protein